MDTAPRVTHHSGMSSSRSMRAWISASRAQSPPGSTGLRRSASSSSASSDTTPVSGPFSARASFSALATVARSFPSVLRRSRTTSAPPAASSRSTAVTASSPARSTGTARSQVPDGPAEEVTVRGFQVTR